MKGTILLTDPLTVGGWTLLGAQRFFYSGWNLVGQVDEVTGTRLSFVWGNELNGSLQDAGGVGGLLALVVHNGVLAGTYFYGYDGNGNVSTLIKIGIPYAIWFGIVLRITSQKVDSKGERPR